jgi:hypothetical protein
MTSSGGWREAVEELGVTAQLDAAFRDKPFFLTMTETVGPSAMRHVDVSLTVALPERPKSRSIIPNVRLRLPPPDSPRRASRDRAFSLRKRNKLRTLGNAAGEEACRWGSCGSRRGTSRTRPGGLASALICALTGAEGTKDSVRAAATDLRALGTEDAGGPARATASGPGEPGTDAAPPPVAILHADVLPPADVPDLCRQVGDLTTQAQAQALAPAPPA